MKPKLIRLIKRWRKREAEYLKASRKCEPKLYELDHARYEGESIGTRWCCEDLEKLLKD